MASCFRSPLRCLLPALATAAFLPSAAWAGPVATRAALDAMIGVGASKETFESYPVAAASFVKVGASLSSTSTPNGQSAGLTAPGVTLSTSNGDVLWQGANYFNCCIPCDHIPVRSWALFKARDLMRHLIESLQADQHRCQVAP